MEADGASLTTVWCVLLHVDDVYAAIAPLSAFSSYLPSYQRNPQFKDKATCLPGHMTPARCFFSHGTAPLRRTVLLDEWMDERMNEYITKHFRGMDVFGNVGGSRG